MKLNWQRLNMRQWSAIDGPFPAMVAASAALSSLYYWSIPDKAQGAASSTWRTSGLLTAQREVEREMDRLCKINSTN